MCRLRGAVTTTGATGGGSFAPSSLFTTEYGYAFDPTDLTKVYQDSAGTTAGVVGQPLGLLKDISGKGRDFSQAASPARPTLQADGFDTSSAGMFLQRADAGLYAAGSATIVIRVKGAASQLDARVWSEGSSTTSIPIYGPGIGTDKVASSHAHYFIRDNSSASHIDVSSGGTMYDGTWHTVAITDSGTAIDLYVDGTHIETQTYTRGATTLNCVALGGLLRSGSVTNCFTGRIGRVIAIGRVLTATERANAITWVTGS